MRIGGEGGKDPNMLHGLKSLSAHLTQNGGRSVETEGLDSSGAWSLKHFHGTVKESLPGVKKGATRNVPNQASHRTICGLLLGRAEKGVTGARRAPR